jgi:hypothetical protein
MKIKKALISPIIASGVVVIAIAAYFAMNPKDTTLEFQVRDSVSKGWVWEVNIILQNRLIKGYYQTDRGPSFFRFTHLKPGDFEMEIKASAYKPVTVPVSLKRGRNVLKTPIDLVAYEIPNLDHFIVFEEYGGNDNDIIQKIRLVGTDDKALINHPCMNLKIAAVVSVQTKGGIPVQEETDSGSERGDVLFQGMVDWTWDGLPETNFRYSSRIFGSAIKDSSAPFLVIDYIFLIPDPRNISDKEFEIVLQEAGQLVDFMELQSFLEKTSGNRFSYYFFTSWNVPGGNT